MRHALALLLASAGAVAAAEPETLFLPTDAAQPLSAYQWTHRPLVVFADNPADPRFIEQLALLRAGEDDLRDRDVIVLTDTAPGEPSELRDALRPRGFALVLIGKDGGVKLRKPRPWDVRELSRVIDKIPTRQQELRVRREASAE